VTLMADELAYVAVGPSLGRKRAMPRRDDRHASFSCENDSHLFMWSHVLPVAPSSGVADDLGGRIFARAP